MGSEKEEEARLAYELKYGTEVTTCGMFISREKPLFAASPDGLIESGQILLEIKCPFSLRDVDLNAPNAKITVPFLDSQLSLRKSHQYFYQIQLGMFVTGCKLTHFFV